jgi:glucokinase
MTHSASTPWGDPHHRHRDRRLLRGRFGIAAEIGHINLVPHGRRCGCGLEGCWEQYASGRALVLEAQELAKAAPAMAKDMLRLAGDEPEMITGPVVTEAAREGDVAGLKCFDVVGTWLGRGMAQLSAVLDPGMFVLGGGVSEAGELVREPAWHAFLQHLTARGHRPHAELRIAELGVRPASWAPPIAVSGRARLRWCRRRVKTHPAAPTSVV